MVYVRRPPALLDPRLPPTDIVDNLCTHQKVVKSRSLLVVPEPGFRQIPHRLFLYPLPCHNFFRSVLIYEGGRESSDVFNCPVTDVGFATFPEIAE